jgi:hypothetical protein
MAGERCRTGKDNSKKRDRYIRSETSCIVSGLRCMKIWTSVIGRPNPVVVPSCLLPVTRDPYPAAGTTQPLAFHPYRRRSWTHYPAARHPGIVGSSPSPVTPCEDISGSRRHRLRFNPNSRRSSGHHDFSRRGTSRCHLLCGCRCCNCRRFGCAAHQSKRHQRQQINAFFHIRLLFLNSFGAGNSALLE